MHQHVRLGEQALEDGAVRRVFQVQPRAALAEGDLGRDGGLVTFAVEVAVA